MTNTLELGRWGWVGIPKSYRNFEKQEDYNLLFKLDE
jgi:hypothetical protein